MDPNDALAAYENRLITATEAVEQSGVESIDELYSIVQPDFFFDTIPETFRIRRAA